MVVTLTLVHLKILSLTGEAEARVEGRGRSEVRALPAGHQEGLASLVTTTTRGEGHLLTRGQSAQSADINGGDKA